MTEPNVEWITATPGRPPILIRCLPVWKPEGLAIIVEEVTVDTPRFDFHGLAAAGAVKAFPQVLSALKARPDLKAAAVTSSGRGTFATDVP